MINNAIEERAEKLLIDSGNFSFPTNAITCAKFLEISVDAIDLDENISGFLAIKGKSAQVGYNQSHSKQRQRFTIAHEIGHYILHAQSEPLFIDQNVVGKSLFLYRDDSSSSGEFTKEREANSFAAALLMPKQLIQQEIIKSANKDNLTKLITELAKKFEVSNHAMSIRLSRLGYFDYSNAY